MKVRELSDVDSKLELNMIKFDIRYFNTFWKIIVAKSYFYVLLENITRIHLLFHIMFHKLIMTNESIMRLFRFRHC